MEILEGFSFGDLELEDEMKWRRDEVGGFSVRSMYEELSTPKLESYPSICA